MPTPIGAAMGTGDKPYIPGDDPEAARLAREELAANPGAKLGPPNAIAPCMRSNAKR